jgi:hypothetical protein
MKKTNFQNILAHLVFCDCIFGLYGIVIRNSWISFAESPLLVVKPLNLNPCLVSVKCQERGWSSFCPSGGHHLEPRPVCDCLRHVCHQTRPRSFHTHTWFWLHACGQSTCASDVGVRVWDGLFHAKSNRWGTSQVCFILLLMMRPQENRQCCAPSVTRFPTSFQGYLPNEAAAP